MNNQKLRLVLLCITLSLLLIPIAGATYDVVSGISSNNTLYTTSSSYGELHNITLATGTGITFLKASWDARVNFTAPLYGRFMRDGESLGRFNLTQSVYTQVGSYEISFNETAGTHQYGWEVYSNKRGYIYSRNFSAVFLVNGTYGFNATYDATTNTVNGNLANWNATSNSTVDDWISALQTNDTYLNSTKWNKTDDINGSINITAQRIGNIIYADQYSSLQTAIDAAIIGDTVYLNAGNYSGNIEISKSITLEGSGDYSYIYGGAQSSAAPTNIINVTSRGVVIRHLKILGNAGTGDATDRSNGFGIYTNQSDFTFQNLNITNTRQSNIYITNNASNGIVENIVSNSNKAAMSTVASGNNIQFSNLRGTVGAGFLLEGGNIWNITADNLVINHNDVANNGQEWGTQITANAGNIRNIEMTNVIVSGGWLAGGRAYAETGNSVKDVHINNYQYQSASGGGVGYYIQNADDRSGQISDIWINGMSIRDIPSAGNPGFAVYGARDIWVTNLNINTTQDHGVRVNHSTGIHFDKLYVSEVTGNITDIRNSQNVTIRNSELRHLPRGQSDFAIGEATSDYNIYENNYVESGNNGFIGSRGSHTVAKNNEKQAGYDFGNDATCFTQYGAGDSCYNSTANIQQLYTGSIWDWLLMPSKVYGSANVTVTNNDNGTITISSVSGCTDCPNATTATHTSQISALQTNDTYFNSTNFTTSDYSYLIWTDGTTIYAQNGSTKEIDYSGTNGTIVTQNVINNSDGMILFKDIITVYALNVDSDTYFEGNLRGGLRLADSGSNYFIYNITGAFNITVNQMIIDGNQQGQTSSTVNSIDLVASNVRISGSTFLNSRHGSILITHNSIDTVAVNDTIIDRNIFYRPWQDASTDHIRIVGYTNTLSSRNIVTNNILYDAPNDAIHMYRNIANSIVSGNTIYLSADVPTGNGIRMGKGDVVNTANSFNVISGNTMVNDNLTGIGDGINLLGLSRFDEISYNPIKGFRTGIRLDTFINNDGLDHTSINNNPIDGAYFSAIYIDGDCYYSTINENIVNNSNTLFQQTTNNNISFCSISSNTYNGNASTGASSAIYIKDSVGNYNKLNDNTLNLYSGSVIGIYVSTNNSKIERNIIRMDGTSTNGIKIISSSNNTLAGNDISSSISGYGSTWGIVENGASNNYNKYIDNDLSRVANKIYLGGGINSVRRDNYGDAGYNYGNQTSAPTVSRSGDEYSNSTSGLKYLANLTSIFNPYMTLNKFIAGNGISLIANNTDGTLMINTTGNSTVDDRISGLQNNDTADALTGYTLGFINSSGITVGGIAENKTMRMPYNGTITGIIGDSAQTCTGCNMTIWNATTGAYVASLNITSGTTASTAVSHAFERGWNYRYKIEAITAGVTRLTFNIQVTKG